MFLRQNQKKMQGRHRTFHCCHQMPETKSQHRTLDWMLEHQTCFLHQEDYLRKQVWVPECQRFQSHRQKQVQVLQLQSLV